MVFHELNNVGRAKYVVNYHDGAKKHADDSPFYDVAIFRNKRDKQRFVASLVSNGYTRKETPANGR